MHRPPLHRWDLTPQEAIALQRELALRVIQRDVVGTRDVRRVAGVDVSYDRATDRCHAAVAVLDAVTLDLVDSAGCSQASPYPYIPGLLSFRELPVVLAALERLRGPVDLFVVDGQGRAHPRHFGLACHLGLWTDTPALGCAKTLLHGQPGVPGNERGDTAALLDPRGGESLGVVLRTRKNTAPVYVSAGHRIALESAVEWVLRLSPRYRLPETTRRAHALSNEVRLADAARQRDGGHPG